MTYANTDTNLVLGYLLPNEERTAETLYAVTVDGRVYASNEIKLPNPHFNRPGTEWVQVEALPEGVVWCGRYERPARIRAVA